MYTDKQLNDYTNLYYAVLWKEKTEDNAIIFNNVDLNDDRSLCTIEIANILHIVNKTTIYIVASPFKFWQLKRKLHMKHLQRVTRKMKIEKAINCAKYAKEFEERNKCFGVLAQIYDEFYRRKS